VTQIAAEFKRAIGTGKDAPKTNGVNVLGWDFAFELNEVAKQQAAAANIQMRFLRIPRDVMDKRAVEQGDIKFFELAALSVDVTTHKRNVALRLKDFVIPPDDVPDDARRAVKHWSQWIDYWAVDWDNKSDTFHNEWQTYRTHKDRTLALETSHSYSEAAEYTVVVKVIDILGNDTTKTLKVNKTFLLIAPNVIVFERLRTDFEGGRIFRADPVIPPELEIFWRDFQCYMRGESERASSLGALYLTNIQQFYERTTNDDSEPAEMTAVLGQKPPAQKMTVEDFDKRIIGRGGPVVVLNDEAHHTHDEESEWNKMLRAFHENVAGGVAAQLDFAATPRHSKGQLFSWTIFDYPLKQAIIDNVVKRPLKGIAQGISEQRSDVASTRYEAYLAAGVER